MVRYDESVLEYLDQLIYELYRNDYFSFIETAEEYVNKIIDYVEVNIERLQSRKSPAPLKIFGAYYISYNPNRRTTWYIFFEKKSDHYLVTSILNNYCEEAQWLS